MYTFQSSQNNSNPNDLLIFAGTSGSHVTVDSVSNNPTGGFGITPAIRWADGGNIQASYTDFSYCGASTTGACFETNPSTSAGKVALDHTTCDHCGQLVTDASIGAASTFTLAETSWTNPTNTSYTLQLNTSTARTTGTRLITFSVITGQISIISTGGQSTGITFTHNVVRKVFTSSAPMFTGTRDVSFDSFDDNLDFANTNSGSADQFSLPSGTVTNFYLMSHCDPIAQCANEHPLYNQPGALNMDISNFVADYDSSDTFGDIFEPHNDATSAGVTLKVHNGVFLCGSTGLAIGSFINNSSATAQTNLKIYFEHITACGVLTASTQTFGVGCEAGTSWPAGAVPSIQNNLIWGPASSTIGFIANSPPAQACSITAGAVTVADYQAIWNISTSIYGLPLTQFAVTPGAHDLTGDPQYVCSNYANCNFLAYDTAPTGLNHALGTGWVTSHAYSVGDIVSSSDATFFGGATYNFICVSAHTSGSTTKPGTGSAWAETWEPATEADIEASVLAGTTFTGGRSMITQLINFVRAGYGFHNAAYHNSGSDSLDRGILNGYVPAPRAFSMIF